MASFAPFQCILEIVGYGYIFSLPAWCTKTRMDISCIGQTHEMIVMILKHICKFFDTFPVKKWTLIPLPCGVAIEAHF